MAASLLLLLQLPLFLLLLLLQQWVHPPFSSSSCYCLAAAGPISVLVNAAHDGRGYIVHATLGHPPTSTHASLLLDTGSDYTWLACDRLSSSSSSSCHSFQHVPCNSSLCHTLSTSYDGTQCDPPANSCTLSMLYGSGAQIDSNLSIDVLTLGAPIPAFPFGAVDNSSTLGNYASPESSSSSSSFNGILGLGKGPLGFPTWTRPDFGGTFSYCLPAAAAAAAAGSAGFLRFGGEAGYVPGKKGCIALSHKPLDQASYGLDLVSMAVGNASVSASYPIIVDSGTVFSHLETSLYVAVLSAIHSRLGHVFQPAPSDMANGLYTCYYYNNGTTDDGIFHNVEVPPVVFNFEHGVSYGPLTLEQLFFRSTPAKFCVGITGAGASFSVLGSFQQQRRLFTFDAINSGVCIDQDQASLDAC